MNNTITKFLLGSFLTLGLNSVFAQNNCPSLGPDQYLPCGQTQTTLNANFTTCNPSTVTANQTNTYGVVNIPFAPQPTVGATNVILSDDSGTGALPIGFTFCFFGQTYTQFYIGSNGWIAFTAGQSTGFVSAAIPNAGFVPKNCIMGPWQDWHPGIAGGPYICYQTLGVAPCRRLVVSWRQCPMYSCTTTKGTFQIIIYETTNLIENHLTSKPACTQWAGGTAVEGIHNLAGTIGITVPGRNSTQWTATNNAWRWFPNGAVITPTITWYQVGNPVAIGTGPTITVVPAATGNSYTCKQDYGPCNVGFEICSAMPGNGPDTVFVQPLTAIIPTITAPTCAGVGSPTTISAAPSSPTNTYLWTGPSIVGPNNTPTITINGPGSYTCAISSTAAACTGTAFVNIAQSPTVTIASTSPSMCMFNTNNSLNSVSLTASGAPNFTWTNLSSVANTYSSTTQPFISITSIPPSNIGSITVIGSNGTCSASAMYTVLIIPNPTITVTSPSVCAGNTVAITASNASSFTWTPPATLSSNTGSTVIANTPTTTIYSVIGTSLGCNSSTENTTVTVVANPTVMVAPFTNTICFGNSLNLTASGATNYTWSPAGSLSVPNGPNVTASPTITTNYIVIGEAATCTTSAAYQVSVIALPSILSTPATHTICQYSSVNLFANGASSYSWSPTVGLNTSLGNHVIASPNLTTIYNIAGNNGACMAFGQVTVYVVPFPNLNISSPVSKICETQTTTIFATGAQSYSWAPLAGLSSPNTTASQAFPTVSTNYTIMGVNTGFGINCTMTKEILIEVLPKITPSISPSVTICNGQSTKLLADGSNTYSWTPSASLNNGTLANPVANPSITTMYTVNISNYGNCTVPATVLVRVNPTPTVYAGEDFAVNLDEPMYLNANGSGTLTWIAGEGIFCSVCPNSQITPKVSGCYKVRATNNFNCIAEDDVCVEVTTNYNIYIPNIFTPNDDGLNDIFLVHGTGLTKFEMLIFDRWGEKLFSSNDQLKGWDGVFKGKLSKNDVYPYLIKYTSLDGKTHTKSGHVTLLK
ncbi:MAG: gliding motility-associated C-terminal domain-containing protein [Sphingobacteriaceae bacterium]|nr:gliding motility-associated C-terminal domain-containing protein [Sphingobacteriaceae bacterium]